MNKKNGFSLLELIFAIVIIGVIAGVAIPKFMDTKDDATAATIKQDVNTIISSVKSYVLVNGNDKDFNNMVSVSSDKWTLSEKNTVLTMKDDANCVKFTLGDSLVLDVGDSTTDICKKIKTSVSAATYDL